MPYMRHPDSHIYFHITGSHSDLTQLLRFVGSYDRLLCNHRSFGLLHTFFIVFRTIVKIAKNGSIRIYLRIRNISNSTRNLAETRSLLLDNLNRREK